MTKRLKICVSATIARKRVHLCIHVHVHHSVDLRFSLSFLTGSVRQRWRCYGVVLRVAQESEARQLRPSDL